MYLKEGFAIDTGGSIKFPLTEMPLNPKLLLGRGLAPGEIYVLTFEP